MSEERNDPPVKGKPKSYSASLLGLPTNSSGNSLPAYFEKRYADKLSQKNIPGTQDPSTSRRIVRDLYESGADLSQIDRIQNRPSVDAKAIQDSPYYNAPPLNFAGQFANSFSSALESWGRGFEKIMASSDGIEAVKELSKLGQESDVVNWGYLQSNIDKADETWSWNNLAKGLGNGLGQMTVAVAAGATATLAAPAVGIGAAGTAIAAGAAGGLSMFPMLFNSQVDDALNNGIDDNHILPYAFTSATVLSALESLPIGKLASKIGVNKIVSEVMQEGIAKGAIPFMKKGASSELIETLVSKGGKVDADVISSVYKSAKNRIIDRLSIAGVAKDMLPEGMEGFVSNYAESMSKWFYDSNFGTGEKGKGSFGVDGSEVFSANQFKKALFDGFVEALVGSPAAVFTNATRPIYNTGLFHGFYSGEAKGMDVESVAQYYNERINAAAQEQGSDGALLYTPEQIDGARAAVDRAARAYSRIGGRIQDPGFRYMVYDRIGQIDELNSRLTSLQERQAAIQNDIDSGRADLSVFTTDVAEINNEIKRTSEILQYNKDKIAEYSNRYFEREKQLARAATQFIDSSIDDMNMSLKDTDVSPSRMTEFVKESRADFETGLAQINAQYPDVAPASVNSTLEFSKADVDAMEVIDVSIPVGGESKVFKVASELVENEDGNPVNVYYNLESVDGEVYTARQIPRTRLYMDRLSEVFEAKARFPEVAEAVASGQISSEEEADFYDRYKSYIDPIVARIKAGQTGAASSAIESGVRLSMISTIQEDAQIYATAQEELNGINEFLGQFSDDDVAGFNSNQKAVYDSVLARKGNLDGLISSYNNAIESITSDDFVDLVELEASNPVAYQIYMESMNEYGLLVGEYNSLSEKRKTEEVKKELANVLEKLKAYPGFEISFIQLQKGLEQRAKIRSAMDANRVAKENKKVAKLMQLIADKKAAQEKLSAIQSEARSRKIIAHSEKLRSVLDSVSKRGALTLNGNETRIYEANISKLRGLDPSAADAIDKDLQILLQGNTQEVNATETKTYENGQEDIPPSLPGGVPVQLDVSGVEPNEGQLPNTVPGMEGGVDTTSEAGGSVEGERSDSENIPPADGPIDQEGLPVPDQPTYITQDGETNQENQEGTQGSMLEGVRDGGQETQEGQDGPELRTEEEIVGGVTQEESAQQAEVDSIDAKISETIQELEEVGAIETEPTAPELDQAKAESNAASVVSEAANPTDGSVLSRLMFMAGATSSLGEAKAITSAIEKLSTGVNASLAPGVLNKTKNPGTFATKQFPASIDAVSASSLKSIGLFDGKISGATAKSPILKGKANLVYNSSKNTFIINFTSDSSSAKFIVDGLSISDVHALLKNPDGSDLSIFEANESGQVEGRSDVGALDSISPELRSAYTMAKYMKSKFPNLNIRFLSESEWSDAKLSQDADGAFGPNGEVLLRKSIATGTTVLHEVGHAVVYALRNGDSIARTYYKALINKVKGSKYEKAVRGMGIREDDIIDEAIAYAIQDKGARFVASERKESPESGNKSVSAKNFLEIYIYLGAQLKKLFGISSSKSPLDMTIDELMNEVAIVTVSTKDLGVLSAHLDRNSVGASAPQGTVYSLYNRFKRGVHHGPASASKPPYYFSSFYDQIMSSGVTRNDIAEFLGYTFSNIAPVASIRRGVAPKINVANPNTKSGFKEENAYDVIRGNSIFLSQMASDLYDVANGGGPSQLKVAGPGGDRIISSEELLGMVDTIGKNYYDWYSRNHQLVIENGKEVWVSRDNKAEADSVRANILKVLAGDFKGKKGKVMGKALQIFTSPFFSKFMNFDTISEIVGGESGLFSGINDLRKFDNERAGQAGHKARKLFQYTIDRLNAARVKAGTAYDLLTERVPFEFYNNLDSSAPPQATQADELSIGHLISIWGTIKTQRAFHKRKFENIIQTKSEYLKSRNAELMDLRSKSPKTKEMEARMKSIKNSIKSAEKAIKDAEVALQNVDKYTDLYYNPNAQKGEMGYHSRQDATGLTARGYTFSMDYTKWNFDDARKGRAPYTKIENEYNILLTDGQIKKLQDMFEPYGSEYKESFDAVWNFFNGAEGRAFIDTVNDTHQSLTGTRADIIDNGYFHTRKYSSIRANDRSIGASAQDLRFLKERESLPGRLIGLDVLSLMNEYVEQNVYYLENARVNESLSNYINNVKLEDVANFQDASLNRKIRSLYEAARDHSETTRDYLQRRRESMKTMKKMGIPYRLWNKVMGNFSRAIFMFNIGTPIKQLGTIFNIIGNTPEISNNNKWRMVPFLLKEGVKSFKTYVAKDGGRIDKALGLSDEVREIMDYMEANIDKGFGTILTRITDISSNTQGVTIDEFKKIGLGQNGDPMNVIKRTWNSVVEKADAYGLEPMRRNDRVVIAAIVKMAKAEVQDRINRNDPAYVGAGVTSINDDFAIREIARMATDLTYKSNNMNMVNDKTPIQNSLDPFAKALTLFSSQPQKIFNTMIQSFIAASRKDFTDPHLNQMARQNLMYGVVVASFYQALITSAWGIMRGGYDEEKDYSQDILVDTLRGIIGMTPDMTTTTISALMTAFDNKPWVDDVGTLPIADIANDMIASAGAYYDSQDETKPEYIRKRQADKFLVDFTTSWSRVLGFPITATTMLRKAYQDDQQPSTNQ